MKLRKYIITIGVISALALSIAACNKKADDSADQGTKTEESADNKDSDSKASSDDKKDSKDGSKAQAKDDSAKQLELDFDNVGNLIGTTYEDIVSFKQEPKEDKKEGDKRILIYSDPAMEFVLYPDQEDPLNEDGYLSQAVKTDLKTAWGLKEDMPVKEFVKSVSATSEPVYTEAQTEGDLAIGKSGQKVVEFESYGYYFKVAYDGDKVTPSSQVGAYVTDFVESLKK